VTAPTTASPRISLATRAWSHLTPLVRGDVSDARLELDVQLRQTTPDPHLESPDTVAETSFSSYVRAVASGDDRLVGLPVFVMRSFRHRCLLVRRDSDLARLEDLRGLRVGATGWPDSGNTWTRSLLRRAGVDLDEVSWQLTSLSGEPLDPARLVGVPDHVTATDDGRSLVDTLVDGDVDAVMAPFVPRRAHDPSGPIRHLLEDYPLAEAGYLRETGFVPGIHILTVKRDLADRHPWLPGALTDSLQRAKDTWLGERWYYADTTPWMLHDLQHTDLTAGEDWSPYGVKANAAMVRSFCEELFAQRLVPGPVDPDDVFSAFEALPHQ
jgi:4,5-dihydroxyphthalate decarboxylase